LAFWISVILFHILNTCNWIFLCITYEVHSIQNTTRRCQVDGRNFIARVRTYVRSVVNELRDTKWNPPLFRSGPELLSHFLKHGAVLRGRLLFLPRGRWTCWVGSPSMGGWVINIPCRGVTAGRHSDWGESCTLQVTSLFLLRRESWPARLPWLFSFLSYSLFLFCMHDRSVFDVTKQHRRAKVDVNKTCLSVWQHRKRGSTRLSAHQELCYVLYMGLFKCTLISSQIIIIEVLLLISWIYIALICSTPGLMILPPWLSFF
jgi:hypothetical protein